MTINTARAIKERLNYETENNVTILVNKVASDPDKAEVLGRGELQVRRKVRISSLSDFSNQLH